MAKNARKRRARQVISQNAMERIGGGEYSGVDDGNSPEDGIQIPGLGDEGGELQAGSSSAPDHRPVWDDPEE